MKALQNDNSMLESFSNWRGAVVVVVIFQSELLLLSPAKYKVLAIGELICKYPGFKKITPCSSRSFATLLYNSIFALYLKLENL